MERNFDVSKYTPKDKANLYFAVAVDSKDATEQVNYLIPALHQAQLAGISPVDFMIERLSDLPINVFSDAVKRTRMQNSGVAPKCTGSCDSCGADRCQPKISVSVGEVLENYGNAVAEGRKIDARRNDEY